MTSVERVVTKKVLGDPDEPWRYWLTRPIEERIGAVEQLRREHHGGCVELNRDFQAFLKSFVKHDVRFLIIGSRSIGFPRAGSGHPTRR
jgi:hypothetical protein